MVGYPNREPRLPRLPPHGSKLGLLPAHACELLLDPHALPSCWTGGVQGGARVYCGLAFPPVHADGLALDETPRRPTGPQLSELVLNPVPSRSAPHSPGACDAGRRGITAGDNGGPRATGTSRAAMKNQVDSQAALQANLAVFGEKRLEAYSEGAPHLMHAPLLQLLIQQMKRAVASCPGPDVRVLDLGAGEGSVTRYWLSLQAHVTAVDLSAVMLAELQSNCGPRASRLRCVAIDVGEYLAACDERFDIVSGISFLHHIPDYLELLRLSLSVISRPGVLLTFADPLRYDTLRPADRWFEQLAYAVWRVGRPDVLGGIARRMRRMRGIYLQDSPWDNAEYHITRSGVDQEAIARLLRLQGMRVEVHRYWSTQSGFFQRLGGFLGFLSSFGILAHKPDIPA